MYQTSLITVNWLLKNVLQNPNCSTKLYALVNTIIQIFQKNIT